VNSDGAYGLAGITKHARRFPRTPARERDADPGVPLVRPANRRALVGVVNGTLLGYLPDGIDLGGVEGDGAA
jgi:hypothetical protein